MKDIVHIIMWVFIGALVVLVVTHSSGFSQSVAAVGGQVTNDAALLAGYAPSGTQVNQGGIGASVQPTGMML